MTPGISRRLLLAGSAAALTGSAAAASDTGDLPPVNTRETFGIPTVEFGPTDKNARAWLTFDAILPPGAAPVVPLGFALIRPPETATMWQKDNIASHRREAHIRLLDRDGTPLARHPIVMRPVADAPHQTPQTTAFAASVLIPLAAGMAALELTEAGEVLFTRTFSGPAPAIHGLQVTGTSVSWKVTHPHNAPVAHLISARLPGQGWTQVSYTEPLSGGPVTRTFTLPDIVTGPIQLACTATDGLHTVTATADLHQ